MLTIVVIAVVVAVLAIAVALVLRRPPIEAPTIEVEAPPAIEGVEAIPGPAPRGAPLPVVLVHGLFGFDRIGVPGARFDYFRGISAHLASLGCHAHAVKLPMMSSVPARAEALVAAITALPHDRIDLVAHSLGGLDARYALAKLGLATRVRSLVTIGTPHRGSPIADLFHEGQLDWLRRLVGVLGLPITALEWLSSSALDKFNREVPDVPGVRYACVVGGLKNGSPIPMALMGSHAWLTRVAGPNDGVVPVSSQFWGETLAEIEADHFAQIGWRIGVRRTFDAAGLYAFVVARLGDVSPDAPRRYSSAGLSSST
ncbi:MAG: esterase/lipase family protein [Kofleriaceae bacterium]